MLKTFQCLGYFVKVADVPHSVIRCIAKAGGFAELPDLSGYDNKTVRAEHKDLIRSWVGVSAFDTDAKRAMLKACVDISRVREDLADIVNFAIEELIRQKYELPAFSALLRAAMKARATVNRGLYTCIAKALDPAAKQRIDQLFERLPEGRRTGWDVIKSEPRQPTVKEIRRFVEHMNWLRAQAGESDPLAGIPAVKLDRFTAEGRALNGELSASVRKDARPVISRRLEATIAPRLVPCSPAVRWRPDDRLRRLGPQRPRTYKAGTLAARPSQSGV
jgi:Domain of unknown function (DUF4158)